MNKPAISFVCPSFNHERYIQDFIQSIRNQTVTNWELIIIDDCSDDNNLNKIEQFNDGRISVIQNKYNRGMNYGLSIGCNSANADIISFVASDDMLAPNYIETIMSAFESESTNVVYASLQYIDENNNFLMGGIRLNSAVCQNEIFRKSFLEGNQLPSPGMAFRKSSIRPFLPLNMGLIQFSDYQLHLLLMHHNKIKIIEEPLINYRQTTTSASAASPSVTFRESLEMNMLMDTVVDLIGNNVADFLKYFGQEPLIQNNSIDQTTIPFWLGRLAIESKQISRKRWGIQMIMKYIAIEDNMNRLNALYGFSFSEYLKLTHVNASPTDSKLKILIRLSRLYDGLSKAFFPLVLVLILMLILFFIQR
jgi:glycosyltransferase involved in cell wall biosynthesis